MKSGRRKDPRIIDPARHPRSSVSLIVAAEFLGMSTRALLARIDEGKLPAQQDRRIWRIGLSDLIAYDDARRRPIAS